jgi:hypothetical protein
MDILNKNKYIEFSHILSGCRTITDAYYFAEMYIKFNPEMGTLIYSMVNGKRYDQVIDFKTIKSVLEFSNNEKYKEDAEEYCENFLYKTTDNVQKKSLSRVSQDKPLKPSELKKKVNEITYIDDIPVVTKNCPHCNIPTSCTINTQYIICGYANSAIGYDWKGCSKDWCFECGKMLCKSWDSNKLLLQVNRYHDNDCCNHHASINNKNYIQDYCQCNKSYVNRNGSNRMG